MPACSPARASSPVFTGNSKAHGARQTRGSQTARTVCQVEHALILDLKLQRVCDLGRVVQHVHAGHADGRHGAAAATPAAAAARGLRRLGGAGKHTAGVRARGRRRAALRCSSRGRAIGLPAPAALGAGRAAAGGRLSSVCSRLSGRSAHRVAPNATAALRRCSGALRRRTAIRWMCGGQAARREPNFNSSARAPGGLACQRGAECMDKASECRQRLLGRAAGSPVPSPARVAAGVGMLARRRLWPPGRLWPPPAADRTSERGAADLHMPTAGRPSPLPAAVPCQPCLSGQPCN